MDRTQAAQSLNQKDPTYDKNQGDAHPVLEHMEFMDRQPKHTQDEGKEQGNYINSLSGGWIAKWPDGQTDKQNTRKGIKHAKDKKIQI